MSCHVLVVKLPASYGKAHDTTVQWEKAADNQKKSPHCNLDICTPPIDTPQLFQELEHLKTEDNLDTGTYLSEFYAFNMNSTSTY